MKVFIDTGAFLALADKADTFHKTTTNVFQDVVQQKALLYTSTALIDRHSIGAVLSLDEHFASMVLGMA